MNTETKEITADQGADGVVAKDTTPREVVEHEVSDSDIGVLEKYSEGIRKNLAKIVESEAEVAASVPNPIAKSLVIEGHNVTQVGGQQISGAFDAIVENLIKGEPLTISKDLEPKQGKTSLFTITSGEISATLGTEIVHEIIGSLLDSSTSRGPDALKPVMERPGAIKLTDALDGGKVIRFAKKLPAGGNTPKK